MTKKIILLLAILSAVFLLRAWDDEELFKNTSTRLKPNIVILMDNSGSMNEIIYYPRYGVDGIPAGQPGDFDGDGYDSQDNYSGTVSNQNINNTGYYGFMKVGTTNAYFANENTGTLISVISATKLKVSNNTYNAWGTTSYFTGVVQGKSSGAYANVTARTTSSGSYYLTVDTVVGAFSPGEILHSYRKRTGGTFYPVFLYADADAGEPVRYESNYVTWFTLHATTSQLAAISHFGVYGTFDFTQTPSPTDPALNPSNCNCNGLTKVKKIFTRIQVAREVSCKVLEDNQDDIRFGLYNFDNDSEGAYRQDPPNDSSELRNEQLKKKMYSQTAKTYTPLAEALADIWRDFKPGPSGSKDYFAVNQKYSFNNSDYVQAYCQGNYVIIVTDGQSTKDDFSHHTVNNSVFRKYPIKRTGTYEIGKPYDYNQGWGDTDATYDSNPGPANNVNRPYCPYETCWIKSLNGNDWLDDVAYFLSHQDMYPDQYYGTNVLTGWPGDQNLITYTIGLNTDNDMLRRTADNGGGQYFTSANFEDLSAAIQSVIDHINLREQEMMFTTFAAPKQSFTYGKRGYIATFIPRNNKTVWEGHLKAYQLDEDGNFPVTMTAIWDAADKLAARTPDSRLIYTVKGGNLVLFNKNTITAADLNVPAPPDDPSTPMVDESVVNRDKVVDFIRGLNGYEDPANGDADGYKLGDIFHFNPLSVGQPLRWKAAFDPTYNTFYENNKTRSEVIYIGTNDGMIHCIDIEDGSELWAFIPPSFLPRLKYLTSVTNAAERPYYYRYFVDGKGTVKDIKVETLPGTWEWKTFLAFGMGVGGKTYCALDVTDPDPDITVPLSSGPKFLWELTGAMAGTPLGCTEARPIIADISNGSSTFAAVILPGGVACDLNQLINKPSWDEQLATSRLEGQALFILNAYTGAMIKKVAYASSTGVVGNNYFSSDLKHQIAAPPSLLDRNNDGVADYLYFSETGTYITNKHYGGRLWKMNLTGAPSTWIPQKIYQAPDGQTLYLGATLGYDMDKHLWILFGTGNRPDITARNAGGFINPSGQFIALYDNFALSIPVTNTNLKDITSWFTSTPADPSFSLSAYSGFRFDFVTNDSEIFYEPMPLLINNYVYMNTFSPETPTLDPTVTYLCSTPPITGYHNIYKFKLTSSGNTISLLDIYSTPGKILGFGLLSSSEIKVYVGPSVPGGFTISNSETINVEDIFGPLIWNENK